MGEGAARATPARDGLDSGKRALCEPGNGEIARRDASAEELIALMLGREVRPPAEVDGLIAFAESLGAVVRAI